MARRSLTDEERDLFETALGDSIPLRKSTRSGRKRPTPRAPAKIAVVDYTQKRPTPPSHLRKTIGIDGNTAERLRRGQLEPQARLDLHGMSERDAHRALLTFVRAANLRNLRLLLVVTGKGDANRKGSHEVTFDPGLDTRRRGILRSLTPRWLREPALAEVVADVREAHRRHGGAGALYVYLRKRERR